MFRGIHETSMIAKGIQRKGEISFAWEIKVRRAAWLQGKNGGIVDGPSRILVTAKVDKKQ